MKLKLCPFCGGDIKKMSSYEYRVTHKEDCFLYLHGGRKYLWLTDINHVKLWNTRK